LIRRHMPEGVWDSVSVSGIRCLGFGVGFGACLGFAVWDSVGVWDSVRLTRNCAACPFPPPGTETGTRTVINSSRSGFRLHSQRNFSRSDETTALVKPSVAITRTKISVTPGN